MTTARVPSGSYRMNDGNASRHGQSIGGEDGGGNGGNGGGVGGGGEIGSGGGGFVACRGERLAARARCALGSRWPAMTRRGMIRSVPDQRICEYNGRFAKVWCEMIDWEGERAYHIMRTLEDTPTRALGFRT